MATYLHTANSQNSAVHHGSAKLKILAPKYLLTFFILFLLSISPLSGQGDTLYRTIVHDGLTRDYILYVPEAYDGTEEWPLVINLHGYSSFAFQQMVISNMNVVADTGHFLIVYPEGTMFNSINSVLDPQGLGWNNGLASDTTLYTEHPVDDVDFISNLIDAIGGEYPVDPAKVYATGYSNGAVMSNVLACELSERIAAIAPVAGTAHPNRPCTPARKVAVLQIHGTADPITDYETGNAEIRKGAPEYLDFWIDFNGCDPEPTVTPLPNLVAGDNSTIELHAWEDCEEELLHYKVINGGHIWPGFDYGPFLLGLGNQNLDIEASSEIWNFFKSNPQTKVVCTSDININTQEEVNNFNCSTITGDLTIEETSIHDLSPLTVLDSIRGTLYIQNNSLLTNLDGLENLTYIGGNLVIGGNETLTNLDSLANVHSISDYISIEDNAALTNLAGLINIDTIGQLDIVGNDALTDLSGLENLSSIDRSLTIRNNAALTNLDALTKITSLGKHRMFIFYNGLWIEENGALTNLDGLANLAKVVGGIFIADNNSLLNLNGLANLTTVGGNLHISNNAVLENLARLSNITSLGGSLVIHYNSTLTKLRGLDNIDSIKGYLDIIDNDKLTDLKGLTNLNFIGGELAITDNDALANLNGLENLQTVEGDLTIGKWYDHGGNSFLTNLDGLANLASVGTDISIIDNVSLTNLDALVNIDAVGDELEINNNDALTNLDGLANIASVEGYMRINNNDALMDLNGLSNIVSVKGDLQVINNQSLTSCCGIYSLLCADPPDCTGDGIRGKITISSNPLACNSPSDVITQGPCIPPVGIFDLISSSVKIYPNPFHDVIQLDLPATDFLIQVFNIYGRNILSCRHQSDEILTLDLGKYPLGIYLVAIRDQSSKISTVKLIKI